MADLLISDCFTLYGLRSIKMITERHYWAQSWRLLFLQLARWYRNGPNIVLYPPSENTQG